VPDPFITTTDMSDYLGRDVSADPGALIALDAACDTVRTFTEQEFNSATGTFTLDGTGTDCLLLPQLPVSAAGTVTVDGTVVTDYVLNGNGMLFRGSVSAEGAAYSRSTWPEGRQNVVITADYGYAAADLPRDVRMVALSLASRLVVQGVAVEESIGGVSVKYAGPAMDLTRTEQMVLRKYRPTR
jgi:hypothetical protein